MASLALHHSRTLFPKFRFPWQKPAVAAALLPTFLTPQAPFNWAIPSLQSLLELFPPFLLAVPKKKVSHSRKAMRSADKGLKDKHNIVNCPACGMPKLSHHLCAECYTSLTRQWKKDGHISAAQEEAIQMAPVTKTVKRAPRTNSSQALGNGISSMQD